VIGDYLDAEEAYGFYIGTIEVLFGNNTKKVGELYFWLAIYYYRDLIHLEKARLCFQKSYLILEEYVEDNDDRMKLAEININLGFLFKSQLKFQFSMHEFQKGMKIYKETIG